jgi:cytochrome P450
MRLYPPVWFIARQALSADEIAGVPIPAKALVTISPYVTHRHPGYWELPEQFIPERFSAQRNERHRYAYLPFGGGRHTCLGNHFAMLEGVFVLVRMTQRYRVRLAPGQTIEPHPVLTLRQRRGIEAYLERHEGRPRPLPSASSPREWTS